MKLSTYEKKGNKMKFKISGIDTSMANAFRRIIISEIPVMAVEKVIVYENSSVLNDEFLAHRLGLIPLKTDLKTYNFMDECSCNLEGCAKCTARFALEVEGPGTIYSKNLKSNDSKIIPAYDKIPIVKLTPKQKIKLDAIAQLGLGKEHIKWQSGLASYESTKDGFKFFVESYGQLSPEDMVKEAFKIFNEKISQLKELKLK